MATINIIGDLINDQTSGLQDDDILFTDLNADFQTFIGTLGLDANQLAFADSVGGASQAGLVNVVLGPNEVLDSLKFTPGIIDAPTGLTAVDGGAITISTADGGNAMVAKDASGDVVAAFWILPDGTVQMATFEPITHPINPDPDDQVDWGDFLKVRATSHVDDNIGDDVHTDDDGPTVTLSGETGSLVVDDTTLGSDSDAFAGAFDTDFGTDGEGSGGIAYSLALSAAVSGLKDTDSDESVELSSVDAQTVEGRTAIGNLLVFTISVDAAGSVSINQVRAVEHADETDPNDTIQFTGSGLLTLTATATDADGDEAHQDLDITAAFTFFDDGPAIVTPFTPAAVELGNAVGESAGGDFAYDVGNDHNAYLLGDSDFASFGFTGTTDNGPISNTSMTLGSEDAHSAVFNWSFDFDSDPDTAGSQTDTAAGTITFDKDTGSYSVALTDEMEAFSNTTIVHTSGLVAKQPTGNSGHPPLVVEQLSPNGAPNPFFVQFSSSVTVGGNNPIGFSFNQAKLNSDNDEVNTGDTAFNAGDLIGNSYTGSGNWVSATQTTNGVAGDTIQKGELLTLRLFNTNILGDVAAGVEKLDPTQVASDLLIKFDGIGSEDLMVVLNLKDSVTGVETTKALYVGNSDIYKGPGNVPAPYTGEFTLDQNDGLVVIETDDYNLAGENWQIQGVQIMQSGNGLTGSAIDFNGLVGVASTGTTTWDATDNDVIKIVDIAFSQTTTVAGDTDADLDFSFQINDGDGDTTTTQNLNVQISNDFIV